MKKLYLFSILFLSIFLLSVIIVCAVLDCSTFGNDYSPNGDMCPFTLAECNYYTFPFVGTHYYFCQITDPNAVFWSKWNSDCSSMLVATHSCDTGYYCSGGKCVEDTHPECTTFGNYYPPNGDMCPFLPTDCNNRLEPFVGTHYYYCQPTKDKDSLFWSKWNSDCSSMMEASSKCGAGKTCSFGQCVINNPNLPTYETCETCDKFVLSNIFGSSFKSYECNPKQGSVVIGTVFKIFNFLFLPVLPDYYPQNNTTCAFSYVKFATVLIVFLLVFLFSLDILKAWFKSIRKNKWAIGGISLVIAVTLSYVAYVSFWIGILVLVAFGLFKAMVGGIIPKLY